MHLKKTSNHNNKRKSKIQSYDKDLIHVDI